MLNLRSILFVAAALLLTVGCDKVEVESKPAQDDSVGNTGPEPEGPPNSVVSWTGTTSYANMACVNGSTLTIKCRPYAVMGRTLDITIPNYSGPGTYIMGSTASAVYYIDNTYLAPAFTSTGSPSGHITITSHYSTVGISGTFEFTLYRSGQTQTLSGGFLDQVRLQCAWPSDLLTYDIGPLSPAHSVGSITSYSNWTYSRSSASVTITHYNTFGVSNPSTQYNTFFITIPLSVSVGTVFNPSMLNYFGVTYNRPSGGHYDTSNASSYLTIDEHDTELRHLRGSFSVLLTGSLTATGTFNIDY